MIEYAVLLTCVIGALLAIQIYFKRGVQGRLRTNVDNIGSQYDPASANSNVTMTITTNSSSDSVASEDGNKIKTETNSTSDSTQSLGGTESIGAF